MTRLKLAAINVVIFAGAVAIVAFQWPHVVKTVGDSDDAVGMILLEALLAGIPIVLWAAAAHYVLARLLMRHGELDEYYARQEINRLPTEAKVVEHQKSDLIE